MQNSLIDYSSDEFQKGFRLNHLEVLNWGTFTEKIWKIESLGFNSLLTGDIGSGKSTLVDAIITLLVPPKKIVYNKAAGVESKERTALSYVRGEYKSQKSEFGNSANPVYLRTENDYSVLLARFYNKGYELGLTLAQVFWIRNEKVEKFFVISQQDLTIKEHFEVKEDERDIFPLKKRLKDLDETDVFDNFRDYSSKFRSFFGIKSEKVMELFNQTVSMKSVGRLTEFMRNHMLEKPDVKSQIEEIKRNFENLTKTYEAVQTAKRQLEQLEPLVKEIDKYNELHAKSTQLRSCLEFLPYYFANIKSDLFNKEINSSKREIEKVEIELQTIADHTDILRGRELEIGNLIGQNKEGQRISQLDKEIEILEKNKQIKSQKEHEYASLGNSLGFPKTTNSQIFYQLREEAENLKMTTENAILTLSNERDRVRDQCIKQKELYDNDKTELDSLNKRKSKIPEKNIRIRDIILKQFDLDEAELPFVGELIQVKDKEKHWEGAAERVFYNFGMSILVSEKHYKQISDFVDRTNLKGRLVYYRVPDTLSFIEKKDVQSLSLVNKIEIKEESEFFDWIDLELREKFDFICCDSIELFHREKKAITQNGQIKGSRGRHEKDDRRDIRNQRDYILGWNNLEKVNIIKNQLKSLATEIQALYENKSSIESQKKSLEEKQINIHDFLKFKNYNDINWKRDAEEIEKLKSEIEELKRTSDKLKSLNNQLESVKIDIQNDERARGILLRNHGFLEGKIAEYEEKFLQCEAFLAESSPEGQHDLIPVIETFLPNLVRDINSIDGTQETARKKIDAAFSENANRERRIRDVIISKMQKYKNEYHAETIEIIAEIEAIPEFKKLYEKIKTENLPKYEDKFKQQLKEGTINDIAMFKNQLENNAKQIQKNIKSINDSLKTIEYGNGTYIELSSDRIQDTEIKEFQIQLRDCLENILGEKDYYTEEKFNQVKKVLDRFNSGYPVDINWTNKVTDVRNWFSFSAIERYIHDGSEKEYYSDSSGKSGGQKEKLAYTILASALAYQFGPAGNQPKSKSFRFVMIDEAFGRGSDESTRYGLDLFKKLNLQLLIITPLQKIHIIENYINRVHFVSNENGDSSMVRDIPIEEYREKTLIRA